MDMDGYGWLMAEHMGFNYLENVGLLGFLDLSVVKKCLKRAIFAIEKFDVSGNKPRTDDGWWSIAPSLPSHCEGSKMLGKSNKLPPPERQYPVASKQYFGITPASCHARAFFFWVPLSNTFQIW